MWPDLNSVEGVEWDLKKTFSMHYEAFAKEISEYYHYAEKLTQNHNLC